MDYSKTALPDLYTEKSGELSNEDLQDVHIDSHCRINCKEKIGDKIDIYKDPKKGQLCQIGLGDKKQILRNTKNKQLGAREIQTCCTNLYNSPNFNSETRDFKVVQKQLIEVKLNSSPTSKFFDSRQITIQSNNDGNILSATDPSPFIEETNIHNKKSLQFEAGPKRNIDINKTEAIDKNFDMMGINRKNLNQNNPQSEQKLSIYMAQNYSGECFNIVDGNSSTNSIEANVPEPSNVPENRKSICIFDKYQKFEEKTRFEEIEDKLEEMFAGIEDEQLANISCKENKLKNNNDDIAKNNNKTDTFDKNCLLYKVLNKSHPTKAAKKSTPSFNFKENKGQDNISMLYFKTRKVSIGMNTETLKYKMTNSDELNENKCTKNDLATEKGMPSLVANLHTKELKNNKKIITKNRNIKNGQRNISEHKRSITFIKSNSNDKKKVCKTEILATATTKQKQQKLKQRMQRLLSTENYTGDRPLLTKYIDAKHRSPFVLVKNNGSISVVNTLSADDSNERLPRSKKTCSNVYERINVKGCHSSTLSNRYDADTADSTWICVFCKIGPHKKRLGDLFGPYIITSDCEEYRQFRGSTEVFQNHQRSDVKYCNGTLTNIKHSLDYKDGNAISNCTLGISQISDTCYEVWIHEECAIWAPNIFVVGSRLIGLEDAAWSSIQYECKHCLQKGALLCCLQRDCKNTSHVPCAQESNWLLDESRFWAYCGKHTIKYLQTKL